MKTRRPIFLIAFAIFTAFSTCAMASGGGTAADATGGELTHRMMLLVFQIGIILFAAKLGARIFEKLSLPSVLGEIGAGVLIGPYCLGAFSFPGFEHGLFPFSEGGFPVSPELYGLSTIASIILLFFVGLHTDIPKLIKYSTAGFLVGTGGVLISFICGDFAIVLFSRLFSDGSIGFMHPMALFLGVISTATSVGITARILLEKKKIDSPEGITILSGAVIDDVLGIIMLAVVSGIIKSGHTEWKHIASISVHAIGIWLAFTCMGLYFSHHIGKALKYCRSATSMLVLSMGMALILAGIFEKSNLAMIIGAYVMGLSLSKTDIVFVIQSKLSVLYQFFVPIFFCVMGMLVNVESFLSVHILTAGLIYTIFAVIGKVVGCALPMMFLNFNFTGMLRVGMGMVPRGEIALIVAGIGLSNGILDDEYFGIAIIMTYITTMIAPFMFSKLMASDKSALKREQADQGNDQEIVFDIPNRQTQELVSSKIITTLENDGFFVHMPDRDEKFYHIRKDDMAISMTFEDGRLLFGCQEKDEAFVNMLFYEVLGELEYMIKNLRSLSSHEEIGKKLFCPNCKNDFDLKQVITPLSVEAELKSTDKESVINEMIDLLVESGQLDAKARKEVLDSVMEREAKISTGLQHSVALPHAKTNAVDHLICGIGIKKDGIDFKALDGLESKIFIISVAPIGHANSQLKFMAAVSQILMNDKNRERVLACKNNRDLYKILMQS